MNIYDITGLGPKPQLINDLDERGPGFHKEPVPDHMDSELDPEMPGQGDVMAHELGHQEDPTVPVTVTKQIDIPLSAIEQIGAWRDVAIELGTSVSPEVDPDLTLDIDNIDDLGDVDIDVVPNVVSDEPLPPQLDAPSDDLDLTAKVQF